MTASELAATVEAGDLVRLQRTPGVGRKTAERILLELKDRLVSGAGDTDNRRTDAVSALVNLGYSQRDATRSVDAVWTEAGDADLGELLRLALKKLTH